MELRDGFVNFAIDTKLLAMHHQHILSLIQQQASPPTQHTFLDSYVGNDHPRYAISIPMLRTITKDWLTHNPLSVKEFVSLITSLVEAPTSTEKTAAGLLLDYASPLQKSFNPRLFDGWLNHVHGWAEVDALCYGHFKHKDFLENRIAWTKLIVKLNKSKNINKRRASLVLLCKPLSQEADQELAALALQCVTVLSAEKEILITKAISWLLRSMVKHHRKTVHQYLKDHHETLPKIAIRETQTKLKTGRKTTRNSAA